MNVMWKEMIALEVTTLQMVIFPVDTCVCSTVPSGVKQPKQLRSSHFHFPV